MILDKALWRISSKTNHLGRGIFAGPCFLSNDRYRNFAGLVEVDEFVKEFRESYKWWSRKRMITERSRLNTLTSSISLPVLPFPRKRNNTFFNKVYYAYANNIERLRLKPTFDILEELRLVKKVEDGLGIATILMERIVSRQTIAPRL